MKFHQATLDNGLSIIAESNPDALSTAVGFFVRAGSRDESSPIAGVSHFLEHMAFKGTSDRSANDVNRLFDEIGAKYNAFTSEEHTVYYAAVLPEYLGQTVDLLAGLLRPSLRQEDFETEKKVILEEIGMYADLPFFVAYERCMRQHFLEHPLGNSVLGTVESVSGLDPAAMRQYHQSRYSPGNILAAAAGNLDFEKLVALLKQHCGDWEPRPCAARGQGNSLKHGRGEVLARDSFVQENVVLLFDAPSAISPLRFPAEILANLIGDETGSRFHWDLIEPGRAESADFSYHEYEGAGVFVANIGCAPELADENLAIVRSILTDVQRKGVLADEVEQAKNKLGARIVLAAERPQNRLYSLGHNWSYRQQYRDVEQELAELEAVTVERIGEVLSQFPLDQGTVTAAGPLHQLVGVGQP